MSDLEKNNPDVESMGMGQKLDEVIEKDPELKEALDNMPKPDEEELEDIFTDKDGNIGDGDTDADTYFNPEDMTGLDEELQNLLNLFGGKDFAGNSILNKAQVVFQKMKPNAILPEYAHPGDAGMDICSCEYAEIEPLNRTLIHTGLRVCIPDGFELQVRPRSGLALKHGITVLNSPGTIDSGYRGEIGIILGNLSNSKFTVRAGDRVAQLVLAPTISARIIEGDVDKATERGESGFGSTGVTTNKEDVSNGSEEDNNDRAAAEENKGTAELDQ